LNDGPHDEECSKFGSDHDQDPEYSFDKILLFGVVDVKPAVEAGGLAELG
jgi:hypothetical protein